MGSQVDEDEGKEAQKDEKKCILSLFCVVVQHTIGKKTG